MVSSYLVVGLVSLVILLLVGYWKDFGPTSCLGFGALLLLAAGGGLAFALAVTEVRQQPLLATAFRWVLCTFVLLLLNAKAGALRSWVERRRFRSS